MVFGWVSRRELSAVWYCGEASRILSRLVGSCVSVSDLAAGCWEKELFGTVEREEVSSEEKESEPIWLASGMSGLKRFSEDIFV